MKFNFQSNKKNSNIGLLFRNFHNQSLKNISVKKCDESVLKNFRVKKCKKIVLKILFNYMFSYQTKVGNPE